jgi:hypothetical protein
MTLWIEGTCSGYPEVGLLVLTLLDSQALGLLPTAAAVAGH